MGINTAAKCPVCEGYGCLLGTAGDRSNPTCTKCDGTGKYWGLLAAEMEIPPGPPDLHARVRGGWPLTWEQLNEIINTDARAHGYITYCMSPQLWIDMGWIGRVREEYDVDRFYVHTRDIEPLLDWARKYDAKKRVEDAQKRLGARR